MWQVEQECIWCRLNSNPCSSQIGNEDPDGGWYLPKVTVELDQSPGSFSSVQETLPQDHLSGIPEGAKLRCFPACRCLHWEAGQTKCEFLLSGLVSEGMSKLVG